MVFSFKTPFFQQILLNNFVQNLYNFYISFAPFNSKFECHQTEEYTDYDTLNYSKDTVQSHNFEKVLFAVQARNASKTQQLKRVI